MNNQFLTKFKAKFWLLFVKEPDNTIETFDLNGIPIVKNFLLFHINKNYNDLKKWSEGKLWFNNFQYPKQFVKEIKAYKLVLEDVIAWEEIQNDVEKRKQDDFKYLRLYYKRDFGCGAVFNSCICRDMIKDNECPYLKDLETGIWVEKLW